MQKQYVVFAILPLLLINAFLFASAQTEEDDDFGFLFIYAESVVRNQEGTLISYHEAERISLLDPGRFHAILNNEIIFGERDFVVTQIDDKFYQWIRITRGTTYDDRSSRSTSSLGDFLNGTFSSAVSYTHDALIVEPGDRAEVTWTVARIHA